MHTLEAISSKYSQIGEVFLFLAVAIALNTNPSPNTNTLSPNPTLNPNTNTKLPKITKKCKDFTKAKRHNNKK